MIDSFFRYTKTEPLISGWKCTLIVEGRQVFCGFKDISNLFYSGQLRQYFDALLFNIERSNHSQFMRYEENGELTKLSN